MFKKRETDNEDNPLNEVSGNRIEKKPEINLRKQNANTILKGSKLIGDINVTCDMELSGDIEGNITSEQNSNIVIKGFCKGNIDTREGNVNIEGELLSGNITAGSDVIIAGKFSGGEINAKGKIRIEGEFDGKLQADEIEIGPRAQGKGEVIYREYISISKGAKIEGQISKVEGQTSKVQSELKLIKNVPETGVADSETPAQEMSGA
jgi:cytoskeletal protein CcmA (bactofilin family)